MNPQVDHVDRRGACDGGGQRPANRGMKRGRDGG
jgi:hypothetical protein